MKCHTEAYSREAMEATGDLLVHTHFGGRFERQSDGNVTRLHDRVHPYMADDRAFLKAAKEIVNYQGHIGYELCSPVLIHHRHAGLVYALGQTALACEYMKGILDSL